MVRLLLRCDWCRHRWSVLLSHDAYHMLLDRGLPAASRYGDHRAMTVSSCNLTSQERTDNGLNASGKRSADSRHPQVRVIGDLNRRIQRDRGFQ